MKPWTLALVLGAVLAAVPPAGAQMVVDRNAGENVDRIAPSFYARRFARHGRIRPPRFLVLQRALPAPQPFGWVSCCL